MFRAWPYPPPPPPPWGRVRLHLSCLGIPAIFQLVCHAFVLISFAFSCYSGSVEARNCRSDRKETGTQIGQIGKTENHIGYQIRKPVGIFREKRKPGAIKGKIRKLQWTPKPRNRSFLAQKPKNRSKNSQNRKTENPNAPLVIQSIKRCLYDSECHLRWDIGMYFWNTAPFFF